MKRCVSLLLALVLLTGCGGTGTSKTPIVSGFRCALRVTCDGFTCEGDLEIPNAESATLTLRAPAALAGLVLSRAAGEWTICRDGLTGQAQALPESFCTVLWQALARAQALPIQTLGDGGGVQTDGFTLVTDTAGYPRSLDFPAQDLRADFFELSAL